MRTQQIYTDLKIWKFLFPQMWSNMVNDHGMVGQMITFEQRSLSSKTLRQRDREEKRLAQEIQRSPGWKLVAFCGDWQCWDVLGWQAMSNHPPRGLDLEVSEKLQLQAAGDEFLVPGWIQWDFFFLGGMESAKKTLECFGGKTCW